jgi:elongation factor P
MISTSDFKTGMTIEFENNIYSIVDFQHVKPGKGGAFVRTKLKNLRSGALIDYTFTAGEKVEKANIEKTEMQYLYADGQKRVFMNTETYEQVEIEADVIKNEMNYIVENSLVSINVFGDELLGVDLPDKVVLEITDTIPAVKSDNTKTSSLKDATLSTGLVVKVPMFLSTGEKIIVSTWDGSYVSRA